MFTVYLPVQLPRDEHSGACRGGSGGACPTMTAWTMTAKARIDIRKSYLSIFITSQLWQPCHSATQTMDWFGHCGMLAYLHLP